MLKFESYCKEEIMANPEKIYKRIKKLKAELLVREDKNEMYLESGPSLDYKKHDGKKEYFYSDFTIYNGDYTEPLDKYDEICLYYEEKTKKK